MPKGMPPLGDAEAQLVHDRIAGGALRVRPASDRAAAARRDRLRDPAGARRTAPADNRPPAARASTHSFAAHARHHPRGPRSPAHLAAGLRLPRLAAADGHPRDRRARRRAPVLQQNAAQGLDARRRRDHPLGSAAVRELYAGNLKTLEGFALMHKTAASGPLGEGWYWYGSVRHDRGRRADGRRAWRARLRRLSLARDGLRTLPRHPARRSAAAAVTTGGSPPRFT